MAKLRAEIAQISGGKPSLLERGQKLSSAAGDHECRLQRLQDILDELVSLTDWKKLLSMQWPSVDHSRSNSVHP
jgi:hypothetical protein